MQQIGLEAELKGVPDFTSGIDKMNRSVDAFAKETGAALDKSSGLVQDAAGRWRTSTGQFATDAEKAAAGVDKIGPAVKGAGEAAEKAGHGFDAFGEIVTGALRAIGELAVQALLKAGQAVAGFIKDSIGLAGDFQSGMLEFQSVAGKEIDTKGLEDFHDLFLQLGKDLPVSTAEVQQAAIEMVKGGIDPATIAAGGLKQNIQFAAAAMGGDLVKAAEISSKIMGGWAGVGATAAEKADFLTHATDMLAKAANASSTDVEGLSRGIFNAQGIARTAGVGFDDLTTTLAELAPRFASSSEAGNSLKNMIVRLQPTTDPATAAMKQLGLYTNETGSAFYDAQGNFVGFEQASQLLQNSLKGLTKEQQAAALQTIFGNDAMGSAAALAEMGSAGYQQMADSLQNANGVMDAAALKQQGFNTSLENAKGSVEALQITLGEKLLPILGMVLDQYIAPFVNGLTDLASAVFGDDDAFNKLSPTMQQIAQAIGQFADDVQTGAGQAMAFGKSIGDLIAWFGSAEGKASDVGGAITQLNGVWQTALKTITDVGNGYMAIAQAVLPIIQKLWTDHGAQISAFVKTTYDSVIKIITLALQLYDAIVPPILQTIAQFFKAHASEIEKVLTGLGQALGAIVTGFLDTLKNLFQLGLDLIHGDWAKAWDDILAIGKAQITAIQGFIGGFFDMIAGLFNTSMGDILKTWENNWKSALDIVSRIDWGQVGADVINGVVQGIEDNASKLMHTLKNLASDALQAAKDALGIASPSKEFRAVGQFVIEGMMAGIEDSWPALEDQVGSIADGLIQKMQGIGQKIQSAIADSFSATGSIDRQVAKNLDRVGALTDNFRKQFLTYQLRDQEQIAATFADPKAGAEYFKKQSDNIFELEDLRTKMNNAATKEDHDRIAKQIDLINDAQAAENKAFEAKQQAQSSPAEAIAAQINDIMTALSKVNLTDDQIKIVDMLAGVWAQLVTPLSRASPAANRPTQAGVTNTTNLSMPIYTNMSPTAIQSSMAIAGAALL